MISVLLNNKHIDMNKVILNTWEDTVAPYHSGIEVVAGTVYNVCPGKVISIEKSTENGFSVNVLINDNQMIRYTHLEEISVKVRQILNYRDIIGTADKFVRFEYCTSEKGTSKWPVRTSTLVMYKQNPQGLLDGTLKLKLAPASCDYDIHNGEVIISAEADNELSNNRGEE